jgi:Carboxypeptidase regulatory-like domain
MKRIAVGLIVVLCCPMISMAANDLAAIHGQVRDSSGSPLIGALVIVAAASPVIPERIAFTDRRGSFSVVNLFAGEYSVKVTMPRFLPALKPGVRLNAGGSVILTVNLQNAMDIVRRATTRDRAQSDDIVWTLRSSRSTQPILRWADDASQNEDPSAKSPQVGNYSGYFQVYSKSVETSSGTTDGVGSQFSVTMPLDPRSKVTFAGQYTEAPSQPRGFGATYDFVPADRHKATVGVNVKQGALLGDPLQLDSMKEVRVKYGEDFQWSDHFVFNYGAEVGRAQALAGESYLRPRFGISWVPAARTTISVMTSSQEPTAADDPIRGKEYFDRAVYVPPALERYSHNEAALDHLLSENTEFTAAVFRDQIETQALFVGTPEGRHGVLILDTRRSPSQGFRLNLSRRFRHFEAGVGFTSALGVGFNKPVPDVNEMRNQLTRKRFQSVAARFKADLDATQTEITAVYRWVSAFSASRIDPYQQFAEYNDPTLSLSIAQNLPTLHMFPAKLQAIVDARNLFEQSFGPQRTQIAQYPRLVKGGINIKF